MSKPEPYYGYLVKKGKIRQNWKLRYFVLEDGKISYFQSPNEKGPLGSFIVRGMECGMASLQMKK
jgi:hypothetical protein